jgi:hypothetical protein
MARLPVLGSGDRVAQKHLPAHLTPAAIQAMIDTAIADAIAQQQAAAQQQAP